MKRQQRSAASPTFEQKIQRLPNEMQSVILSKLPVYDQKLVNKAQRELQRLRAAIFYDFFKILVAHAQNTTEDFKVYFYKSDAAAYEYKKVAFVTSRSASSGPDKQGEYTLKVRTVDKANVSFYANGSAEHVMVATSVWCTANVYPIVANLAEKLFPGLKVKVIK
jgi:hypothetical protein